MAMKSILAVVGSLITVAVMVSIIVYMANQEADGDQLLTVDTNQVDFGNYYDSVMTGTEDFTVTDVLMREENNFLQGLYYDPSDGGTFYESAGLYGQSHVQKLKQVQDDGEMQIVLAPDIR